MDLCQVFGGMTVKIPTLQEVQKITSGLLLYAEVNINKKPLKKVLEQLDCEKSEQDQVLGMYEQICDLLKDYSFGKQL